MRRPETEVSHGWLSKGYAYGIDQLALPDLGMKDATIESVNASGTKPNDSPIFYSHGRRFCEWSCKHEACCYNPEADTNYTNHYFLLMMKTEGCAQQQRQL